MPRPPRLDFRGAIHHVIVRGNERRSVFRDDEDRSAYLRLLEECAGRYRLSVLAYCLMSNHVHLAVQTGEHPLDRAMHFLHSVYAQRFNRRHGREGHLFQGRYRALLVQNDSYLLALIRYIHENPVKAGLVGQPELYPWSSDRPYRKGDQEPWLKTETVLCQFSATRTAARRAYARFMEHVPDLSYEEIPVSAGVVKGDESFAVARLTDREKHDHPLKLPSADAVAAAVAACEGITVKDLRSRRRDESIRLARAMAALLGREWGSIPYAEMARFLGRESSTVVKMAARFERRMRGSVSLQERFDAARRSMECQTPSPDFRPDPKP